MAEHERKAIMAELLIDLFKPPIFWAWEFPRDWFVAHSNGVEVARVSRRELEECNDIEALIAEHELRVRS
jgi:hypothetical protein